MLTFEQELYDEAIPLEHSRSNSSISSTYSMFEPTTISPPLSASEDSFYTKYGQWHYNDNNNENFNYQYVDLNSISNVDNYSLDQPPATIALTPPSEPLYYEQPAITTTTTATATATSTNSSNTSSFSTNFQPYTVNSPPSESWFFQNNNNEEFDSSSSMSSPASNIINIVDSTPVVAKVMPQSYVKWVKLTRMSPQRIERIKALANDKGIGIDTVDSVLTLYSNEDRADNEVNRYCGEDVYIKITMGNSMQSNSDEEPITKRRYRSKIENPIHKKKHRKQKPNYVKRPLNSFMLYRKSQTQSAMAYALSTNLKLNHQNISQIIGLMWQTESKEIKDEFAKFAGQEKELHKALYPDYKFCPQKKNKKQLD